MTEKPKILIVDDDQTIRTSLSIILQEEGYDVDTAETGKEAIEKSNSKIYNVALLDFRLPDIEGTKLLTLMKDTVPKMRKIMLTGYPSMTNAVDSVNFGADAFLVKPCETSEVLAKIEEQLKKQKEDSQFSQLRVAEYIETQFKTSIA